MAEIKTKATDQSVAAFIDAVPDEARRRDCLAVLELMKNVTGEEPKMWGTSIVGFGDHHYVYESGHEGDCALVGFSPRKQNLTLYFMSGFSKFEDLMSKLGKHKTGKGCLYINKLQDVDVAVLKKLIEQSVKQMKKSGRS